jgi:hypothetical protein
MIGRYWSTGIKLRFNRFDRDGGWAGSLDFFDNGFADDPDARRISTQGRLQTRYFVPTSGQHQDAIAAITDTLREDAGHLGIEFREPWLYAQGDGEDPAHPMPDGWRAAFGAEATRLGWGTTHSLDEGEEGLP